MDWLGIRTFERTRGVEREKLAPYAEGLGRPIAPEAIAAETRMFGAVCDRTEAGVVLKALGRLGSARLEELLPLGPAHWAGVPTSVLERVIGARPRPGDLGWLARIRFGEGPPLFLGGLIREGCYFALFDGLAFRGALQAAINPGAAPSPV